MYLGTPMSSCAMADLEVQVYRSGIPQHTSHVPKDGREETQVSSPWQLNSINIQLCDLPQSKKWISNAKCSIARAPENAIKE